MKRCYTLLYIIYVWSLSAVMAQTGVLPQSPKRETRAVWLTTFNSLDWPKAKANSEAGRKAQQEELRHVLDRMQEAHINTVLLQTRVRGTVIYPSAIEPWDACLTGTPGLSPGYDPLAFAIEECHKRGMELHAWLVTIPCFKVSMATKVGARSVLKTHPKLCVRHDDSWYLDPGQPGTAEYLAALCREITTRYDVDGIHFDYIRYPENPVRFNDVSTYRKYGRGRDKASWRRENITHCVRTMFRTIKSVKPWVKVSCSPVGKFNNLSRYSSYGWNAFSAVYQDAQGWLREGVMDILFPMMYFRGNNFYPFVADWKENDFGRVVAPGLGIYFLSPEEKDWPLEDIRRELFFVRSQGLGGQAYFRYAFLDRNHKGIFDFLKDTYYPYPALPMPCNALDTIAPEVPKKLHGRFDRQYGMLEWTASKDNTGGGQVKYNVYASREYPVDITQACHLMAVGLDSCAFRFNGMYCVFNDIHFAVTAIDRFGNESAPAQWSPGIEAEPDGRLLPHNGNVVRLPLLSCRYVAITDASGRILRTMPYAPEVRISGLSRGLYTVRTLERQGRSRRIGEFFK